MILARQTDFQHRLLERMRREGLIIHVVIDDNEGTTIELSDDEYANTYEKVRDSTLRSLVMQDVLKIVKDWQPCITMHITDFAAK